MKNYNWNWYKRKITWIGNVLVSVPLRFSYPFRDKKLWVFACWEGKRYDDNARYLYEYISSYHPEIKCVWISRDANVVNELKKSNKEVYLSSTKAGIKCMLKAGASFYTNGLDDFSDLCFLYGSKTICLNHGNTGIKKAAYTLEKFEKDGLVKKFKQFRDKLFSQYHYDLCVTTSQISSHLFRELYGDPDERKYIITGMPRNDILINRQLFTIDRPKIIVEGYRYILYLPTYREYKNTVIKDLLENLMNDRRFISMLEREKVKFLVKPHNIDVTSAKVEIVNNNFMFVKSDDVESTQVLMAFSDCLITDYSSCGTDFALTKKPVLFYVPDFDRYNKDNGFRDMWMQFYVEHPEFRELNNLKDQIYSYFCNGSYDTAANDWINSVYLGEDIVDTIYSENVYKRVIEELGIK